MITMNCLKSLLMLKLGCLKLIGRYHIAAICTDFSLILPTRRVEELVDNQSRRWEEFCRMANNMKSLSADMIQQVWQTVQLYQIC